MTRAADPVPLRHHHLQLSEVTLHVVEAGPATGTPVVLLHGFPDLWVGWKHQIQALATAGYRVIAPDQRGYGSSSKPSSTRAYHLARLADDIAEVADLLNLGPFHLVGHDWGGAVCWRLATAHAHRVRTLTVANCPPADVLQRTALSTPRQLLKSWYVLFFQIPGLADAILTPARLQATLKGTAAPGTFSKACLEPYRAAWSQPGAATAMLRWYRAAFRSTPRTPRVEVPVMLLWGMADTFLGPDLIAPTLARCSDARLVELPGCSHWVPHEQPDAVNAALLEHLASHGGPDPYVYKLASRQAWQDAPDPWPGAPVDLTDGFVHLSAADQVEGTRSKHFADVPDLLRLAVDPSKLPAGALRWEVSRGGARFPHLYAPLPKAAVVSEAPLG